MPLSTYPIFIFFGGGGDDTGTQLSFYFVLTVLTRPLLYLIILARHRTRCNKFVHKWCNQYMQTDTVIDQKIRNKTDIKYETYL